MGQPDSANIWVQCPVVVGCDMGNTGARPFVPSARTVDLLMVHKQVMVGQQWQ